MTLPDERLRAVIATRQFLRDLLNPSMTKGIPKAIRERASRCLRHYPHYYEMETAAEKCPEVFAPINIEEQQYYD